MIIQLIILHVLVIQNVLVILIIHILLLLHVLVIQNVHVIHNVVVKQKLHTVVVVCGYSFVDTQIVLVILSVDVIQDIVLVI